MAFELGPVVGTGSVPVTISQSSFSSRRAFICIAQSGERELSERLSIPEPEPMIVQQMREYNRCVAVQRMRDGRQRMRERSNECKQGGCNECRQGCNACGQM